VTQPSSPTSRGQGHVEIDTTVAHAARVYDYLLGGTSNFAVDREAAHRQTEAIGGLEPARAMVRVNRDFLVRVVRYLVHEAGIRQFLDVGTGMPNADNVHGVAQDAAPESRIVYVDNDPVVLAHAHALLKSTPEGATDFLQADLRDPDDILQRAAATLDLTRPVGVMLVGVLHFLLDDHDDPYGIVGRLLDAVVPGSAMVVSHLASDIQPEAMAELTRRANSRVQEAVELRCQEQVTKFFDGLTIVEPGVVPVDQWRPLDGAAPPPGATATPIHGAVGLLRPLPPL
jgi:S-adenosyl methyltransferase